MIKKTNASKPVSLRDIMSKKPSRTDPTIVAEVRRIRSRANSQMTAEEARMVMTDSISQPACSRQMAERKTMATPGTMLRMRMRRPVIATRYAARARQQTWKTPAMAKIWWRVALGATRNKSTIR